MNGKQLKNSILQWAIQGKLVPQDPNDEPASVLLERIRAERKRLIKEGKIKKDKNESIIYRGDDNSYYEKLPDGRVACIDEEIPFEVPKGWNWERFGNLVFNRDSERIPLSVSERNSLAKNYDYYGASGVIDKVDRPLFHTPLLLIGEDGANLINRSTPIAFIAKGEYWVNNHAHVIDSKDLMELEYLCLYINAIPLTPYVTGTAQPKMNQEKMNSILVAVPPIEEQKRIVKKYSVIEPIISRFALAQRRMDKLNDDIYEKLRKSILQEAIQGHLVAQDPNDEPASLLIVRISTEKQRMLKEGKLKQKDICDSVIFKGEDNKYYEKIDGKVLDINDEIPYDIPASWSWVRLQQVCTYIHRGKSPKYSEVKKFPVIAQKCNQWDGFHIEKAQFIAPESVSSYAVENLLRDKDLLWNSTGLGTLGRIGLYPVSSNPYGFAVADSHVTVIRTLPDFIRPEFLLMFFSSPTVQSVIEDKASGSTKQKELATETVKSYIVPIPPLAEQDRILDKYKTVLASWS